MNRTDFERFLEPEEPKIVGRDWQSEPIYEGDEYVETEYGYVLFDEITDYLRSNQLVKVAGMEDF